MKIKAYFITYNNDGELNDTLKSFEKSGIKNYNYEVKVINNFKESDVKLDNIGLDIEIVNNNTRPSISTGHLTRNWNECLIDGFENINSPKSDIVILSQNDVKYNENIIDTLIEYHQKYNFITSGQGDAFHSYTIDAIKSVGLWDERFCNIGWQESDYFLRHIVYNKEKSSINDLVSLRVHNQICYNFVDTTKLTGFLRNDIHHIQSLAYHETSMKIFNEKWPNVPILKWTESDIVYNLPKNYIQSPQWILYPYFENSIEDLKNKNYFNYEN